MKKNFSWFKIISYSMAIIGTTIGAGFVSGKEISNFMNVYGNFAYLSAITMGVVYVFTLNLFFNCADTDPYKDKKYLDYFIGFTQFISMSAMIAGLDSVLSNYFGSKILFYVFLVVSFVIILCGLKGLTNTNFVLIPFLLGFILFIGYYGIKTSKTLEIEVIKTSTFKVLTSLPIYIGLDLFGCYPICLLLGKNSNKKERLIVSIIVGITIGILIICYLVSVLNKGTDYAYFDLPILNYTIDHFDTLYLFACGILTIGIVTTLLSNGFVLLETTNKLYKKNGFVIFLGLFCLSYLISFIGFSAIVEYLYPLLGVVGLIIVIDLFIKNKKSKRVLNQLQTNLAYDKLNMKTNKGKSICT